MDSREAKALEIAARSKLVFENGAWLVPSQTTSAKYRVTLNPVGCTCDDFQLRQLACKHVIAARLVSEREGGPQAPAIDTDTIPKRPTYQQNWTAYNLAQSTEKHRLQVLLADLCAGIPEPDRARGRKPIPLADQLFACVFKVYTTVSTRRFACDLKDAHEHGYLSRTLHHNKINAFLCDPDLTPLLKQLVVRSALPLRTVETEFAVDSSGFSTSKFVRMIGFGVRDCPKSSSKEVNIWTRIPQARGMFTWGLVEINYCPFCGEAVETCRLK